MKHTSTSEQSTDTDELYKLKKSFIQAFVAKVIEFPIHSYMFGYYAYVLGITSRTRSILTCMNGFWTGIMAYILVDGMLLNILSSDTYLTLLEWVSKTRLGLMIGLL